MDRKEESAFPVYVCSRNSDLAVTGWMSSTRKEKLEVEAAANELRGIAQCIGEGCEEHWCGLCSFHS